MPSVSVIIPCYNEQATIGLLLDALYRQSYPVAEMEVVIADGMSSDATRAQIAAFQERHPDLQVQVVDNPDRHIPAGLNIALQAARGDYIMRLDAHSVPVVDYIERCVTALQAGKGRNVGGIIHIRPGADTWISQAIAVAAAHPLGVGDARYRVGGQAQAVDTVAFGAYDRGLVAEIGPYDESLLTNEDYEFNTRIRQAGGTVWFDPQIRMTYFARASLAALARQYWRYGFWKLRMLLRYPETIRWRQALPPLFVLIFILLGLLSLAWPWLGLLWLAQVLGYSLVLLLAGLKAVQKYGRFSLLVGLPLAITTMHFAWGSAFLWSALSSLVSAARRE
ncbi:MAG: glycosyltransferase family 2 protein [Anaerolineales bacterium]|nr:glycosyltransferase family 2 protein [Anaerolineales bacterium]